MKWFLLLMILGIGELRASGDHGHHHHGDHDHHHHDAELPEGPSVLDYLNPEDEGAIHEAMGFYQNRGRQVEGKLRLQGVELVEKGYFEEGFFVFFYDVRLMFEDLRLRVSRVFLMGAVLLLLFSIPGVRRV